MTGIGLRIKGLGYGSKVGDGMRESLFHWRAVQRRTVQRLLIVFAMHRKRQLYILHVKLCVALYEK
jgi:hypothetical protein